ncbi:MAG: type III-B CRISPR module RAMP protein Cmr4, partial [Chloroflexota bacterium]
MADTQANTLLFLYAETALHPGTGSSLGIVDLPIQRERTTQYPTIQSSSIKGVLRSRSGESGDVTDLLYGPSKQEYAGAISFSDAKILLFPIRSMAGVFTWITCPSVLARLKRDLAMTNQAVDWKLDFVGDTKMEAYLTETTDVIAPNPNNPVVALEEFLFTPKRNQSVTAIAKWLAENAFPDSDDFSWWREKVKRGLVILNDNDFRDFVTTATEVVARTRLEPTTKKVASGALWYQEFLPAETLFYSVVVAQEGRNGKGQDASK